MTDRRVPAGEEHIDGTVPLPVELVWGISAPEPSTRPRLFSLTRSSLVSSPFGDLAAASRYHAPLEPDRRS